MTSTSTLDAKLVSIKAAILSEAFELGSEEPAPTELVDSLDKMFESLGIQGIGESTGAVMTDPIRKRYDVWTHHFTELRSNKFGESTHLLIGTTYSKWSSSRLYDLIVVTNKIKVRDDEEFEVLRRTVSRLGADKGFGHLYERPGQHYGVDRTIRLHQTLDKDAIVSPDETIKKALAIPPTYAAYVEYQRQKDERIDKIVGRILNSVDN